MKTLFHTVAILLLAIAFMPCAYAQNEQTSPQAVMNNQGVVVTIATEGKHTNKTEKVHKSLITLLQKEGYDTKQADTQHKKPDVFCNVLIMLNASTTRVECASMPWDGKQGIALKLYTNVPSVTLQNREEIVKLLVSLCTDVRTLLVTYNDAMPVVEKQ